MNNSSLNSLLINLIQSLSDYPWMEIIVNSNGENFDYELEQLLNAGHTEIDLFLQTDDMVLNAYPQEEIDEPNLSFILENITYNLYID